MTLQSGPYSSQSKSGARLSLDSQNPTPVAKYETTTPIAMARVKSATSRRVKEGLLAMRGTMAPVTTTVNRTAT